ncbi:adenosylcobinamide-GDP ribazoletransferase [Granulosicoccaceae sp. 1_MG-2023]|nr:adenosylcobinamide-GDP ribazoletransferase [Granulosicoccaceae sp. 1_MG-2023]
MPPILNDYFVAQTFLSRLTCPHAVDHSGDALGRSTAFFPLVGTLIGLLAALLLWLANSLFDPLLSATLAVMSTIVLTGAFHEDGLADTADGIGGGFTLERKLEIMRDSRIGTYGATALLLGILLRIFALASLPASLAPAALILAHTVARFSSLPLIYFNTYVREQGTGKPFAAKVTPLRMAAAGAWCLLIWLVLPGMLWPALIAALLSTLAAQAYFRRKLGGITGDTLGAANQAVELSVYLVLAALSGAVLTA